MFDFIPDELKRGVDDIRNEMLSQVSDDLDKTQGSYIWDSISPVAIKIAELLLEMQEILKRAFVQYSYGEYLDLKAQEYGLQRKPATKATGSVIFEGNPGTTIPAGIVVSTEGDSSVEPVLFRTTEDAVIGDLGRAAANIEAIESGKQGNVPANSIILLGQYISGVTKVYNPSPTSGGTDVEDDESFRARILQAIRDVRTGGNVGDYKAWTLEVAGVGKVQVIPCKYGAGTVGIVFLDSNLEIPTDSIVEEVQNHIAPRYVYTREAEDFTIEGSGVSIEDLLDDSGQSVVMSEGTGKISLPLDFLESEGVWEVKIRIKVDNNTSNNKLLRIYFVDSQGNIAYRTPLGEIAEYTYRASDLNTYYDYITVRFYNNKTYTLYIERLQDDIQSVCSIDRVEIVSMFGKAIEASKVPVGASVYAEKPEAVPIDISCRLVLKSSVLLDGVKTVVEERIRNYFKEIALEGIEVSYQYVGALILGVSGVYDVKDLRLNGGVGNIPLKKEQVPVLGKLEVNT